MTTFRCPYCGWHSNKWIDKCPDCGFTRNGKEVIIDNGDIKHNRGSSRERRKVRDNFRGGRNTTFAGKGDKRYPKGEGKRNGGGSIKKSRRVK